MESLSKDICSKFGSPSLPSVNEIANILRNPIMNTKPEFQEPEMIHAQAILEHLRGSSLVANRPNTKERRIKMPNDILKPCPFCGGEPCIRKKWLLYSVWWKCFCWKCGCRLVADFDTKEQAERCWNSRYE